MTVVRNETNVGYARACNEGAAAGQGELILFLNSDAVARAGAVDRLADALVALPLHSAATGRLVHLGTDTPQVGFALRRFPTVSAQVALLVGLERYWPSNPISRKQLMLDFDYDRTQDVEAQPAGACLLVRRSVFDALDGFDEEFFYWFEDIDLVRRLRERGPIRYVHDATFEHAGGEHLRAVEPPADDPRTVRGAPPVLRKAPPAARERRAPPRRRDARGSPCRPRPAVRPRPRTRLRGRGADEHRAASGAGARSDRADRARGRRRRPAAACEELTQR